MGRRPAGPLDRLFRRHAEWCNGRIFELPNIWVLVTERTPPALQSANGIPHPDRTDADGRLMRLIRRRGIFCPNPLVGQEGPYPRCPDKPADPPLYFVPASVCRQCPWRWPRGEDGLNYPHCGWAIKVRGGQEGAVRNFLKAEQQAAERVGRLLGGPK